MIPGTYIFKVKVSADGGATIVSGEKTLIVYGCPNSCKSSVKINGLLQDKYTYIIDGKSPFFTFLKILNFYEDKVGEQICCKNSKYEILGENAISFDADNTKDVWEIKA